MKTNTRSNRWFGLSSIAAALLFATAGSAEAAKLLTLVNGHFSDGTTSKWLNSWNEPTIYANAAPFGQEFDQWSPGGSIASRYLDGIDSATTRFNMGDNNVTLTATYSSPSAPTHHLEARKCNSDGDYANGETVTIVAVPRIPDDNGKVFDKWEIVFGATVVMFGDIYSATTTFTMPNNDAEIRATFKNAPAPHELDVHGGGPDDDFVAGTIVTITANAPAAGKVFDHWQINSGADASMFGSVNASVTTFTMPNNDVDITSIYVDAVTHWLHVINSGSDGYFYQGQVRTIQAFAPPSGQVFSMWRIDSGATTSMFASIYVSPTTFTMPNNDVQITAIYDYPVVTTNVLTVVAGSGSGSYASGTAVPIVGNAAASNQVFLKWVGGDSARYGSTVAQNTTYLMPDTNVTVTGTYVNVYLLTVNSGTGDGTYTNGTTVNINADAPSDDEAFDSWTGAPSSRFGAVGVASTTYRMTNGPTTITATYTTDTNSPSEGEGLPGMQKTYALVSVGTYRGEGRVVIVTGMRRRTWAQYALWSDYNGEIYFKTGEELFGLVHSNGKLWFSGSPRFYEKVSSASSTYGGSTNACTFEKGFKLDAPTNSMANVAFSNMMYKADLVVTGTTYVTLEGTNILITNSENGWTNYSYGLPGAAVIAVRAGASMNQDVLVGGMLDGRLTIVAERDIRITNHITYATDPLTNAACDDALGLIANRNVVIATSCPDDVNVYAHIMATGNLTPSDDSDGSFGVENYDLKDYDGDGVNEGSRGELTVWGGIVQNKRGAVGTFSGATSVSGFDKNYRYDIRFASDPPPEYPPMSDSIDFDKWRDQ